MLRRASYSSSYLTFPSSSSFSSSSTSSSLGKVFGFAGILSFSSAAFYSGRALFSSSSTTTKTFNSNHVISPQSFHTYRFCSSSSSPKNDTQQKSSSGSEKLSLSSFSVTELRDQFSKAKSFYERARLILFISMVSLKFIGLLLIALCVYKVATWVSNYYQRKQKFQETIQNVTEKKNEGLNAAKEKFGQMKDKVVVDFKNHENVTSAMKERAREVKDKLVVDFKVIQEKRKESSSN